MNLTNSVLCDNLGGLLCNLKSAVMLVDLIFTMTANVRSPKYVLKLYVVYSISSSATQFGKMSSRRKPWGKLVVLFRN